ncbi:MAG: hypothetical protein IPG17_08445 [Sandaracinaceae bacterium]|jgi:hypothetical protein|nr:hypothetical protein [Sandaracinaceae bacterium]MBP7681372.1 hypothetical protein [Deltaproteobacteria bacterium]MBK6813167.1 hypothetical protein [Sandaracinaceae bacterium]MBK7152781.1 hypothetical protein [Sandaracinaceae bacterium]MBK7774008.1 hypothetical protein [Sandaracinaceae bacterium]
MVTVENRIGRLIEVRQTGKVTIEELQESFPVFQRILSSSPQRYVMATDWRGMRVLDAKTSEALLGIMRSKNDRIERQMLVMDPSAVMGLQVRRLFKDAGGETRAVFESADLARGWLEPALTPLEVASLKRFLTAGIAA